MDEPPAAAPATAATAAITATAATTRWELWRQDDNGNRYLVSAHPDEPAARRHLAELESGVIHKQTYWIRRTTP